MKKKFLLLLTTSAFALSGCLNGIKKTTYADFHEKAVEAAKEEAPEVKKVVINGTVKNGETTYTAKNLKVEKDMDFNTLSTSDIAFIALVGLLSGTPATANEVEGNSYYVGNGYKIKSEDAEITWDKHLNCTSIKGKVEESSVKVTARYTYEK